MIKKNFLLLFFFPFPLHIFSPLFSASSDSCWKESPVVLRIGAVFSAVCVVCTWGTSS